MSMLLMLIVLLMVSMLLVLIHAQTIAHSPLLGIYLVAESYFHREISSFGFRPWGSTLRWRPTRRFLKSFRWTSRSWPPLQKRQSSCASTRSTFRIRSLAFFVTRSDRNSESVIHELTYFIKLWTVHCNDHSLCELNGVLIDSSLLQSDGCFIDWFGSYLE